MSKTKTNAAKPRKPAGSTIALSAGVAVSELRPTQMTVGAREVEKKRKEWREADHETKVKILRSHTVPTVLGPKGKHYLVDHHHFAKALLDEEALELAVYVLADLQHLPKSQFWTYLDNSAWCHAYDQGGKRRELSDIPKTLSGLKDDPYRSLVGELIRHGGLAKSHAPFSEFLWADFFRYKLPAKLVESDYNNAVAQALILAKSHDAKSLPGWAGVHGKTDAAKPSQPRQGQSAAPQEQGNELT